MGIKLGFSSFAVVMEAILALLLVTGWNPAMAAGISGLVTDGAREPVRGAMVKATLGTKTVTVYTNNAGRYQIGGLDLADYSVTVDAFGFALSDDEVNPGQGGGETNFRLTPYMDVSRLTSAEIRFLVPEESDEVQVFDRCSNCHGFETILPRAGMHAAGWKGFLPYMTVRRSGSSSFSDALVTKMLPGVLTLFGPEGLLGPNKDILDYSRVRRVPVSDKVLGAKITEWKIPSPEAMAHSVTVDKNSGIVWFGAIDVVTNNLGRFDPETEAFDEFPIPIPGARPHTGTVLSDGRFMIAMDTDGGVDAKLITANSEGELETFDWPEKPQGARVVITDPTRENVVWIVAGDETWSLNVRTKEFRAYPNPSHESVPQGSYADRYGRGRGRINSYAIAIDSKGYPWVTQFNLGVVFRLDPDTGETKVYHVPEMLSARGIGVDADNNVWYADYYGHKLGKLDPKTGEVTEYQPPTRYATPYGITVDLARNHVWYGDTVGNNITRFDPETEEFIEYPIPTRNSSVRFMGIDSEGRAWYGGYWGSQLGMIDPGNTPAKLISSQ